MMRKKGISVRIALVRGRPLVLQGDDQSILCQRRPDSTDAVAAVEPRRM
jgi:hypothetical protein